MRIKHRALAALLAFATVPALAATPAAPTASFGAGGSAAEAADAFARVCMAHPGDPVAQRAAALAFKPRAFQTAPESPPGIESFTLYFTQLSLLDTPRGQVCAVLAPMFDAPATASVLAETRARLNLGPGIVAGEQRVWPSTAHGRAQTIAFSYHDQTDAMGKPRPTIQLTLTAMKAN